VTDEEILTAIIQREGGGKFTDLPADRGGPTRWGITEAALEDWRRPQIVTAADVEHLEESEARAIYRQRYLARPGIGRISNDDVRAVVLDCAVNHGPVPAIQLLQRALGVKDDGKLGPVTLAAVPYLNGKLLAIRVLAERARLYGRIISKNLTDRDKDGIPDNVTFAWGWMNRLADMIEGLA